MIVQFVRDPKRVPHGIVVGLDNGNVGWSMINTTDGDKWDRDFGLAQAIGRAVLGEDPILKMHRLLPVLPERSSRGLPGEVCPTREDPEDPTGWMIFPHLFNVEKVIRQVKFRVNQRAKALHGKAK